MSPRPERIAASARALGAELLERLALDADAIAHTLATELALVPWDREQVVGDAQARQWALREVRFRGYGGAPVRVLERRSQPLESLEPVWAHLRRGRRVRVEFEPGVCSVVPALMRNLSRALGVGVLSVAEAPLDQAGDESYHDWPWVGVEPALSRVAMVDQDADAELAAYLLARSCLRRSGQDPRSVHVAWVAGVETLERYLHRLWLGVRMGPVDDPASFAGPVGPDAVDDYLAALGRWEVHPGVRVVCPGGLLDRAGDGGHYLAPALFESSEALPELPVVGPMLVMVAADRAAGLRAFAQAGARGHDRMYFGTRTMDLDASERVRVIRGALLLDRLPPGMPKPRPI